MIRKYISHFALLLSALLLWQCEPNIDSFQPSNGTADFSSFVTIGDSYTAGYTDGALSQYGQMNSFSAIMAKQLMSVGTTEFKQPLIPEGKSIGSAGNASLILYETGIPSIPVAPLAQPGNIELLTDPSTWINGQYHNIGVPGAKSFHLLAPEYGNPALGAGNFNPFYARFASQPGVSSMLTDAMANTPTFFNLWLAGNDVLSYALSGGQGNVGGTGTNDITDEATFTFAINTLLTNLSAGGAKGVIGNIPDIEAIPYISYIQYDALELTADLAAQMNAAYAAYNAGAAANGLPTMDFKEGRNAFVIADPTYPIAQMRQALPGEKILISALAGIQSEDRWGSATPIPNTHTLHIQTPPFNSVNQVENIKSAIVSFNAILKAQADAHGVAFADINALMEDLKDGYVIDGHTYTTAFITGGIFSLDGIHSTARGSAIIANSFIEAINNKYGAQVPKANVNDYITVEFP